MDVSKSKRKPTKAQPSIDRTGLMDASGPESVADYERLLMSEPNSSLLWLGYMTHHLRLHEIDKAREIARRAIGTIKRRDRHTEQEAMNLWIALLNLEIAYGDDESLEEVFAESCVLNDAQEMHARLAELYIKSRKHEVSQTSDA